MLSHISIKTRTFAWRKYSLYLVKSPIICCQLTANDCQPQSPDLSMLVKSASPNTWWKGWTHSLKHSNTTSTTCLCTVCCLLCWLKPLSNSLSSLRNKHTCGLTLGAVHCRDLIKTACKYWMETRVQKLCSVQLNFAFIISVQRRNWSLHSSSWLLELPLTSSTGPRQRNWKPTVAFYALSSLLLFFLHPFLNLWICNRWISESPVGV